MPLKTIVKVGNINNLSDARYCSGMGVDMLGIAVAPSHEAFLSPDMYQEIRGWISGPSIVVELYGITSLESVQEVVAKYAPDYLELSLPELPFIPDENTLPLLIKLSDANVEGLTKVKHQVAYVIVDESNLQKSKSIMKNYNVLVQLNSGVEIQTMMDTFPINGLAFIGSPEVRPGFKDYGDMADILEQLEID